MLTYSGLGSVRDCEGVGTPESAPGGGTGQERVVGDGMWVPPPGGKLSTSKGGNLQKKMPANFNRTRALTKFSHTPTTSGVGNFPGRIVELASAKDTKEGAWGRSSIVTVTDPPDN